MLRKAAEWTPSVIAIGLFWFAGVLAAATSVPAGVAKQAFGHGVRLTDAAGFSLYANENDRAGSGTSSCVDACAEKRPPLIAESAPTDLPPAWSLIERDDGAKQWAFRGKPLHRYVRDREAGTAYGEGNGWITAFIPMETPPEVSIQATALGHVLASATGRTLYYHDAAQGFDCDRRCARLWQPLAAPWLAVDHAGFSVARRADGVYQWAHADKPLFLYARDANAGDVRAHGLNGEWRAAILEPAPPIPDWVQIVGSDGGSLYADSEGITLHALYEDQNSSDASHLNGSYCDQTCLDDYWEPVAAESKVAPIGEWSVIANPDGSLQWAHLGLPLYTFKLESEPGELYYTTYWKFQWLKPIMYELPVLPGLL